MSRSPHTAATRISDGNAAKMSVHRSILAVDDEENFLTLLQWFLTQRGYDVQTASSVEEAALLAQKQVFDVALLDLRIGATNDGLVLLDELNQHLPTVKVIMMTAYPTVSSIKQAFDRGAARFLTKPVDLQELCQTIQTLL
ncbi:MAG TPA: response regulator [Terriglobales bacterium]|nr:response regulator [Terriglobales bacterium]